jgi:hypothetical protein
MQRTTSSARSRARLSNRLFLLLVGSLLCGTAGLLRPVLALLACSDVLVHRLCILAHLPMLLSDGGTYAAVCWASRSWRPGRNGRACSGARTSSSPRRCRRRGRSQWTCHHRTGCGNRRRRPGPCPTCKALRAWRGAHPWRRWDG